MLEFSTHTGLAIPFNIGENDAISINRCPFFFLSDPFLLRQHLFF